MDYTVHATFAAGDDGDHETVVADGDEILLQRSVLMMRAQKAGERFFDEPALAFRVAAQAAERDARVIGQSPVRQNLSAQLAHHLPQIGDGTSVGSQPRIAFFGGEQDRTDLGCYIQQTR